MNTQQARFELRDHTADIILFVSADSLPLLFATAAEGFYAAIGEITGRPDETPVKLSFAAPDLESLMVDFLDELLYRFDVDGAVLTRFTFDCLNDTILKATAASRPLDRDWSTLNREVKAITYHDLRVQKLNGRYEVEIVLDI